MPPRHCLSLDRLLPDLFQQERIDLHERIGLDPLRLVKIVIRFLASGFIFFVQREIHRKKVVSLKNTLQQLFRKVPNLGPGPRIGIAFGRRVQKQRILARAGS